MARSGAATVNEPKRPFVARLTDFIARLAQQPRRPWVGLLGLAALAALQTTEHAIGSRIALNTLYALIVALTALLAGGRWAVAAVLAGLFTRLTVLYAAPLSRAGDMPFEVWQAVAHFGAGMVMAGLAAALRHTLVTLTQRVRERTATIEAELALRERAEEAASAAAIRLQAVLDASTGIIFAKDRDGVYTLANVAFARVFSRPLEEIVGRTDADIFPLEQAETLRATDRRLLERGEVSRTEDRLEVAGETRVFDCTKVPLRDASGRIVGLCGFAADITERKRSEEALRESEENLRATLESIGDAAITTDTEGRITRMNRVAEALTGWTFEEVEGRPVGEVFHIINEETRRSVEDPVARVLAEGVAADFPEHTVLVARDGLERPIADRIAPIRLGDGPVRGVVLVFRDQTEERARLRALEQARRFAAGIVETLHEPVVVLDADLRVIMANRAFYATFATTPHETEGRAFFELGDRQWDIPALKDLLGKVLPQNTVVEDFEVEHDLPRIGRRVMRLNAWRLYEESGATRRILLAIEDITARRRSREELEKRERYYRTLMHSLRENVFVIDRDYVVTDVNDSFLRAAGRTREGVVGRPCYEVSRGFPEPCHRRGEPCPVRDVFRTGRPRRCQHVRRRADGSIVCVDILASPIRDAEGNVTHVVEAARDITDLVKAHEQMRESEKRFRQFFESHPAYCYIVSPEGLILDVNRTALEVLGYEKKTLVGKPVEIIYAPESRAKAKEAFAEWKRTGRISDKELILLSKEGRRRTVLLSAEAVRNPDGSLRHSLSVQRDITEQRRLEDDLRAAAKYWQTTFDAIPDPLMVLDTDHRIVRCNTATAEMFGGEPEDFKGRRCWEIVHGTAAPPEGCPLVRTCKTLRREQMDLAIGEREFEVVVDPILDESGRLSGLVHALRDITEAKRSRALEERLRTQREQTTRLETIGRLAGGVAHDFNNLLTGIKGYARFLTEDLPPGPLRDDAAEVGRLADRAAHLTGQLLAFGRRQALEPRAVDLNHLIADLMKMFRRLIGEDINVVFEPASDLGAVRADPGQIEQVLMNLVVNARDAMPSGGTLTLETANVVLDEDYAKEHVGVRPGPYVMLAVTDTGQGMDKETQQHIFDPFFTTKAPGTGAGMGLATVYGIVKQHGGNIWVYSEPGQGTTFKVYLPRIEDEVEALPDREAADAAPRGEEALLVLEDEAAVRKIARRTLERLGYTVFTAATPSEAEAVFAEHGERIALLLTDVVLPERSGREVYEALAARRPDLKVLYMSGYTDNVILHHGVLHEGVDFVQKPFNEKDLARKVREILDR